jgi:hypothetical protein
MFSLATTTGLAAFGGRVDGVWTERPKHVTDSEMKAGDKHSGAHGTVEKVAIADFRSGVTEKH